MRHRPRRHGSSVSKSPTGRRARSNPSHMGTSSASSWLRPSSTSPSCWCSTNLSPGSTPPVSTPSGTCLVDQARAGCCVLFSSHQLDLVEDLCEQVTIIDHGRLVVSGTVDDLASSGARRLVVRVEGERMADWARGLQGVSVSEVAAGAVRLVLDDDVDSDVVLRGRHGRRTRHRVHLRASPALRGVPGGGDGEVRLHPGHRRGRHRTARPGPATTTTSADSPSSPLSTWPPTHERHTVPSRLRRRGQTRRRRPRRAARDPRARPRPHLPGRNDHHPSRRRSRHRHPEDPQQQHHAPTAGRRRRRSKCRARPGDQVQRQAGKIPVHVVSEPTEESAEAALRVRQARRRDRQRRQDPRQPAHLVQQHLGHGHAGPGPRAGARGPARLPAGRSHRLPDRTGGQGPRRFLSRACSTNTTPRAPTRERR